MTAGSAVPHRPIVVGVEGSETDETTVAWATNEAVRRQTSLQLVHAQALPSWFGRNHRLTDEAKEYADARVAELLEQARAYVNAREPAMVTESHHEFGAVASVLSNAAREASLVVVGASPTPEQKHTPLRSVAGHVAAHAPCPVVVAHDPGDGPGSGDIIVGVDGSRASEAAVAFACEETVYRGIGVAAVLAWEPTVSGWPVLPDAPEAQRDLAADALAGAVARWQDRYPTVPLEQRLVQGPPVRALLDLAPHASLLVVGSHGHGWFPGLLLGSVSNALIRHAPVTVAVVRGSGH
ncbi:universal stress protein [Lipingzhangella sp. LS1_29]|uniref:Universal stress protein n=1 Tax=Lipingzhangella rawalii TaxID=2055835 RepID=A0ABU2HAQ4_9ACTN|nr:universal stress protein [Lipingzhangella rawalii]MDS1272361.1 universal stress protein [Lipingzhangella rawalii]